MNAAWRGMIAVACLACAGGAAAAEEMPLGEVGLYYIPSSRLEGSGSGNSATFDGHGYGIQGTAFVAPIWFLNGRYQQANHDNSGVDLDLDDLRLGGGVLVPHLPLYAGVEYVRMKFSDTAGGGSDAESGFGVHAGAFAQLQSFSFDLEAGYFSVGDAGNGFEYSAGAGFDLTRDWTLIAGYRASDLKKNGVSIKPRDVSVGLRFNFY